MVAQSGGGSERSVAVTHRDLALATRIRRHVFPCRNLHYRSPPLCWTSRVADQVVLHGEVQPHSKHVFFYSDLTPS